MGLSTESTASPQEDVVAEDEAPRSGSTEAEAQELRLRPLSDATFDPLVVQISRKPRGFGGQDGFIIHPEREDDRRGAKVMLLGNSASIWPLHRWGLEAAAILKTEGIETTLFNGAVRGHSSAQELLRVVRDVPAIRPDVVIAMSGICDAASIVSFHEYPFAHVYMSRVEQAVLGTKVAVRMSKGARDTRRPSEIWLQNTRFARMACEDLGATYIACLQPLLGVGDYVPSEREQAILNGKAQKMLHTGVRYLDGMRDFYREVQERLIADPVQNRHVVDLSNCLVGLTEAFGDHRHPHSNSEPVIGQRVAGVLRPILRRLMLSGYRPSASGRLDRLRGLPGVPRAG